MTPLAFQFNDINEAYAEMMSTQHLFTQAEDTRNGFAFAFQTPVLITHAVPERRVLFDPIRDANPFFHYMEAIWMLAGHNNVDFPARFAKNIRTYSDDGRTIHGAYGYRWREHFRIDQIDQIIFDLQKDPSSRRAVMAMWDANSDLGVNSKDLPCNTHIYFRIMQGDLHMTVCNRSNDMVWGCLGANAVHFSVLQEFMANALNLGMGKYHQFTNNLHIYEGFEHKYSAAPDRWYNHTSTYDRIPFSPVNLDTREASDFVANSNQWESYPVFTCPIIVRNAIPMMQAWGAYKLGDFALARHYASNIFDEDWKYACIEWLTRRANNVAASEEG